MALQRMALSIEEVRVHVERCLGLKAQTFTEKRLNDKGER